MLNTAIKKYQLLSVQVKASFWFLICSVFQKGISVITTPIFTRLLSTSEYGRYYVFNSWLDVVSIIVTLNLCAGVYTMGIVKFKEEEMIFTSSLQGLNLTLCSVWTIIYLLQRNFWNNLFSLTTVQMLSMILMIWASSTFRFWMTTQRNQYKYKTLVIITALVSIFKPALSIFLVLYAEDKVTARILGITICEMLFYTPFFFIQLKKGKVFFSAKYWKYAVFFNIPLVPHYLSNRILSSSDRIMIQKLVGESEAGIYSLAYSLALLMMMVNDALNKTMSPWLYQKIRTKQYDKMYHVVFPSLVCVGLCDLFLIMIAPELVFIFAPPQYMTAIYVIVPVALSGFFSYMYLCFAPLEFYFEKRIWTTIGTFTSAIINIILNLICIPLFGYIAAGYTTLLCSMINAFLHMYFVRSVCRNYLDNAIPYDNYSLIRLSIILVLVGFLFIPLYSHPLIRYLILAMSAVVIVIWRKPIIYKIKNMTKE